MMKNRLYKSILAIVAIPFLTVALVMVFVVGLSLPFVALIKPDWITTKGKQWP